MGGSPDDADDAAEAVAAVGSPGVAAAGDDAAAFHAFFERYYAELARLAHLLTGEADAADDLAADALVAVWRHWDRVCAAQNPAAYARGVVANLARSRIRSAVRERRRVALFWDRRGEPAEEPDVPAVLDLREALQRLPFRKRACVVLRHAFDLSERDTAAALGVSVGTVKSQTSRGVAELERLLGPAGRLDGAARPTDRPRTGAGAGPGTGAGAGARTGTGTGAGRPRPGAAAGIASGPAAGAGPGTPFLPHLPLGAPPSGAAVPRAHTAPLTARETTEQGAAS